MKSAPSIAFEYRPSRQIAGAAMAISLAAIVAPWLSGLPFAARVILSLAALAIATAALARFVKTGVRRIAYRSAGWKLFDTSAAESAVELVSHVRLGCWLALDFRNIRHGRFRALLGPDNIDAETRRRLILLLSRAEVAQTG
jgi:hypothetical protein